MASLFWHAIDPPIPCRSCGRIYQRNNIKPITKMSELLYGDAFFVYKCQICTKGREEVKRWKLSLRDFTYLLLFHLSLLVPAFTLVDKQRMIPIEYLFMLMDSIWDAFSAEPKTADYKEKVITIIRTELHLFFMTNDFPHLVGLRDILLLPCQAAQPQEKTKTGPTKKPEPSKQRVKRTKTQETKSKKPKVRVKDLKPTAMIYLDIPNPPGAVVMNPDATHSAPQCQISKDGLSVTNAKGYRLAKASHGVQDGEWYFECEIVNLPKPKSNVRIGWSQISGDLQAPCGFDQFSYGFRAMPGTLFQESHGKPYGRDYGLGDVLGVYIKLPKDGKIEPENHEPLPSPWNLSKPYECLPYYGERPKLIGSEIRYFINGEDLGVAFSDIYYGKYHPAVSCFMEAAVCVNFGDTPFKKLPLALAHISPFSSLRYELPKATK